MGTSIEFNRSFIKGSIYLTLLCCIGVIIVTIFYTSFANVLLFFQDALDYIYAFMAVSFITIPVCFIGLIGIENNLR